MNIIILIVIICVSFAAVAVVAVMQDEKQIRSEAAIRPCTMTDKLKPCPFCGGEAELIEHNGMYWIECKDKCCGCELTFEGTSEGAIERWNTRKPIDDIVELLEELLDYSDIGDSDYIDNCNACINQAIEIVKTGGKGE